MNRGIAVFSKVENRCLPTTVWEKNIYLLLHKLLYLLKKKTFCEASEKTLTFPVSVNIEIHSRFPECVCVCVCVRARACVCMSVCV